MSLNETVVRQALQAVNDPEIGKDLVTLNMVGKITINGGESYLVHLDPEGVISKGLDADFGHKLQSSKPGSTYVWDTVENLGLEAKYAFRSWGPSITMNGVCMYTCNS